MPAKISILLSLVLLTVPVIARGASPGAQDWEIRYPDPEIHRSELGTQISLEGCWTVGHPGEPALPVGGLRLLLPQGTVLDRVEVLEARWEPVPGRHRPRVAQGGYPISRPELRRRVPPDQAVFQGAEPFPASPVGEPRMQFCRGYAIACLPIHPVVYHPREDRLEHLSTLRLRLHHRPEPVGLDRRSCRDLEADRRFVRRAVANPEMIGSYRAETEARDTFEYVIITSHELQTAPTSWSIEVLREHVATSLGVEAIIATVGGIYYMFPGVDHQTAIRMYLTVLYEDYGTQQALLMGDADGGGLGENIVPVRGLYCDHPLNPDDNIPADLYYGCLDGSFDHDGDGIWGEPTDGPDGGEVDLAQELLVGRLPVDRVEEVTTTVWKTIQYDGAWDPDPRSALMVGEHLAPGITGKTLKEQVRLGATMFFPTQGFPAEWTVDTLYHEDAPWDPEDVLYFMDAVDGEPRHLINHVGHAAKDVVMDLYASDAEAMINPWFVAFSQGCYCGSFDNRWSETSFESADCVAEAFVTAMFGAAAFATNSRYGQGGETGTDGGSHLLDRAFFDAILADRATLGEALAAARLIVSEWVFFPQMRFALYECNLLGAPHLDPHIGLPTPVVPTATPTRTPTAGPATATPTPPSRLSLLPRFPAPPLHPGMEMWADAEVEAFGDYIGLSRPLMAVLDIGTSSYWFWPSWREYPPNIDYRMIDLRGAADRHTILAPFPWPEGVGSGRFWLHLAILNEALDAVEGSALATVPFEYQP